VPILILFGFITSFFLSIFIIPSLIHLANEKKLFDVPDFRKVHQKPISSLGGVAIFCAIWLSLLGFAEWQFLFELRLVLLGSFILFLIGIKDDLIGTSPQKRLLGQLLAAGLCFYSGFQLDGFYGLFDITELPIFITFPLTILTIVLIINAFNLIDGINGLAGSLGILAALYFTYSFWQVNLINWALVAVIISGSIAGFLKYNFGRASIFMGDNGSTLIGLLIAVFFIKWLNTKYYDLGDPSALVSVIGIIFIPVFDLIRVFLVRIFNRKSPFSPDKTHLHHFLLAMGKNHVWACLFILGMQFLAIGAGNYFVDKWGITLSLIITIAVELAIVIGLNISLGLTNIKNVESDKYIIGLKE